MGLSDLFNTPFFKQHHLVGHGHGLHLVVGDIYHGQAQLLLQRADLVTHFRPELGIQVRQWFIHETDPPPRHDGACQRHPLPLPTGKLGRLAVQQILEANPKILENPAPVVKVHELADSSVNFVTRPWSKTSDYWDVYWEVTRAVKEKFDAEGVSIPFPQQDVHMHQVAGTEA